MSQAIEFHWQPPLTSQEKGWKDGRLIFFSSVTLIFFFIFSLMLPFSSINKQNRAFPVLVPYIDWIYHWFKGKIMQVTHGKTAINFL